MCSGYGIAFDGKGRLNFGNDFARNVFEVDNSPSSHTGNDKINFQALGEGPTYGTNGSFGPAQKSLVLILGNCTKNFAWVCILMMRVVIFS